MKASSLEPGSKEKKVSVLTLRDAIHNDELRVEYQPRYDVRTGELIILEALVRWRIKYGSTVYPDEFIGIAVKHGLIYDLGIWIFKKCCDDLIWLRKNVNSNINISINISPVECESLYQTQNLIDICHSYGLQLSDFEFEITDTTRMYDACKVKKFCDTVINNGSSVSTDDISSFFSSSSTACELPISIMKIDRSLTSKIGYGGRSEILIKHLIEIAHDMNINVVAVGVEHAYQRDHLINIGCDQLQGFYLCKPITPLFFTTDHMNVLLHGMLLP